MNGRDLTFGILGTLVVGAEIQRRARRMEEGGEGSAARTQSMGLGLLLVAGAAGAYLLYPRKAQAQVAAALKDGIPAANDELWALAKRLEKQGRLIAASALFKLLLYRQLQAGCVLSG